MEEQTRKEIKVLRRDEIYSHIRQNWFNITPEEWVRQNYVVILVNKYGYDLDQMDEEYCIPGSKAKTGMLRADIVIWPREQGEIIRKNALIVVECKEDDNPVSNDDFNQGKDNALLLDAKFLIVSKNGQIGIWQINRNQTPEVFEKIDCIPHAQLPHELILGIPVNEKLISVVPKDWVNDMKQIYEFHMKKNMEEGKARQGRSGGWGVKKTARDLRISEGKVSQAIRLVEYMEKHPYIQNYNNKQDAWREYQKKERKDKICDWEEL